MVDEGQTVAVGADGMCDTEMRITTFVRAITRGLATKTQEEMQSVVLQILLELAVLQVSKLKGEAVALGTRVRASSTEVQPLQMTYDDSPRQKEFDGEVVVKIAW